MSFAAAAVTYHFIEKPVRARSADPRWPGWLALLLLATGGAGWIVRLGVPSRLTGLPEIDALVRASLDRGFIDTCNPGGSATFSVTRLPGTPDREVLFLGDSHMEHYWARLLRLSRTSGAPTIAFATYDGCLPFRHQPLADAGSPCEKFWSFVDDQVRSPRVTTVVISTYWEYYFERPYGPDDPLAGRAYDLQDAACAFADLEAFMAARKRDGKRVYVVLSSPTSPTLAPLAMIDRVRGRFVSSPALDRTAFEASVAPISALLKQAALRAGATVLDPLDSLCAERACPAVTEEGEPIYLDEDHLRPFYVREHAAFLDRVLE